MSALGGGFLILPQLPTRDWGKRTLAQLKALGTAHGVQEGDTAFDTTHVRGVVCISAAAGTSVWGSYWRYEGAWTFGSAAKAYLRWGGGTTQSTITGLTVLWTRRPIMITNIRYGADSDPGATTVGVHSARNTTALEEVAQATMGAATPKNFAFTATATIPADGELSVAVTTTNAPNNFSVLVEGYRL